MWYIIRSPHIRQEMTIQRGSAVLLVAAVKSVGHVGPPLDSRGLTGIQHKRRTRRGGLQSSLHVQQLWAGLSSMNCLTWVGCVKRYQLMWAVNSLASFICFNVLCPLYLICDLPLCCVLALQERGGNQGHWRWDQEGEVGCWWSCPSNASSKAREILHHDSHQRGTAAGKAVVFMGKWDRLMFNTVIPHKTVIQWFCFAGAHCSPGGAGHSDNKEGGLWSSELGAGGGGRKVKG